MRKRRILTWLRELERDGGTGKVRAVLDEVLEACPGPEHAGIAEAFALWAMGAARKWGRSEEMARLRDEGRREGHREGYREGYREGRRGARTLLERQVTKKFGADAAVQLSGVIGSMDGRDQLDAAADAIVECDTAAELLARLAN